MNDLDRGTYSVIVIIQLCVHAYVVKIPTIIIDNYVQFLYIPNWQFVIISHCIVNY